MLGAAMDYAEHEKAYSIFIALAKFGGLIAAALLVALAFGVFAGGFFSAAIIFVLVCAIGRFILN